MIENQSIIHSVLPKLENLEFDLAIPKTANAKRLKFMTKINITPTIVITVLIEPFFSTNMLVKIKINC